MYFFKNLHICGGVKDYSDVICARLEVNEPFPSENENTPGGIVENWEHCQLIKDNFVYVRHPDCQYFCGKGDICTNCFKYTDFLRSCRSRLKNKDDSVRKRGRVSDDSTTNVRWLSRHELVQRLENTQHQKREAMKKVARMSSIINELIIKESVNVSSDQHEFFSDVMKRNEVDFQEDTPQGLLWQQQKEQLNKKDSRGMRWHPLVIRWCLSIYYTSASAYAQLSSKKINFLRLPHVNTLKKYAQFTTADSGFNPDIIKRLIEEAKVESLKPFQRNVVLSYDEMQIKSQLVYKKSTGQMIGFTEMCDIKDNVEECCKENSSLSEIKRDFATHVIVYMVRGIFTNLTYPFGYFASAGFTSAQLYPCTLEATRILESIGLLVRAYVSDGASPNRKFYKMLLTDDDDNIYWTWNPCDNTRKIYFISDVPHLLKTTRNCMENSHWNKDTRNLHVRYIYEYFIRKVFSFLDKEYINSSPSSKKAYLSKHRSMKNCSFNMNELIEAAFFIIDNSYISFQDTLFRQIIGIPMGTNCAPHLANIYLHVYEYKYLQKLILEGQRKVAKKLSNMYRYQDDCIAIDDDNLFGIHAARIYPPEMV